VAEAGVGAGEAAEGPRVLVVVGDDADGDGEGARPRADGEGEGAEGGTERLRSAAAAGPAALALPRDGAPQAEVGLGLAGEALGPHRLGRPVAARGALGHDNEAGGGGAGGGGGRAPVALPPGTVIGGLARCRPRA